MGHCGGVRFVLIHSPLVGPATWKWVAEDLRQNGHEVAVPDLRGAAQTGDPAAVIAVAAEAVASDRVVIVGHSGAGAFLPSIATGAPARLVFVDAGIPPCSGEVTASGDFMDRLRTLSSSGVLPKWSTWWGDSAMEALVPDDDRRRQIVDELPEIPLALYESPVTLPERWCELPSAFVLLSDAYRADADTARSRQWPILERVGGSHLDIINMPSTIAADLVALASRPTR